MIGLGAAHRLTAFHQLQIIGGKHHRGQKPAQIPRALFLSIQPILAGIVFHVKLQRKLTSIAAKTNRERTRACAFAHKKSGRGIPERGDSGNKLKPFEHVGFTNGVRPNENRKAADVVQLE